MNYYECLKIDPSADLETIKLAYKQLAKKYHPDVYKASDCLTKMSEINEAYEILKNPTLRGQYDQKQRMQQTEKSTSSNPKKYHKENASKSLILAATTCMIEYFEAIRRKNYSEAYQLIGSTQKGDLSLLVFKNWQHWVSRVYNLIDFKVSLVDVQEDGTIGDLKYKYLLSYQVEVDEFNQIMEHYEKGCFVKRVIVSGDQPYIYLEQTEVTDIVRKYEKLAKMKIGRLKRNTTRFMLSESKSQAVFFDQIQMETERFVRYATPFSLVFLGVRNMDKAYGNDIINILNSILEKSIRKLDRFILLEKSVFLILLPGSQLTEGQAVAEKICELATAEVVNGSRNFTVKRTIIENELTQFEEIKLLIKSEVNALVSKAR